MSTQFDGGRLPEIEVGPRALVVDDDALTRRVHRRLLTAWGFDVEVAEDGVDAIGAVLAAEWRYRPFDLVMTDIDMPIVDGWVAASMIRHNGYIGALIVVSGTTALDTPARCASCGVDHFVMKPTSVDELKSRVDDSMAKTDWRYRAGVTASAGRRLQGACSH